MLTQRMTGLTMANLYTGDYAEAEWNERQKGMKLYELIQSDFQDGA